MSLTAAADDRMLAAQARNARLGGLAGALALHALVLALLLWSPPAERPPTETMVVEMVTLPAPEPPVSEPPAPALPPLPPPEDVAELPVVPPPPPPQLSEAPIAERSSPPPAPVPVPGPPRERPVARVPQPVPTPSQVPSPRRPAPVAPQSTPFEAGRHDPGGGGEPGSVASQSVQDFILAQIARHWLIDVRGPRFRNIVLYGNFVLLPDGMLAAPHGKNDPWNPRAAIKDYDRLVGPTGEVLRSAIETFLLAARQAQPFRLPPDGKADEPRALPLRFRLGDL